MLKIKKGKGVMSKDGVTPWAAATLHATQSTNGAKWKSPYQYSMASLVYLIDGVTKGNYTEVELIDEKNRQFTISLDSRFVKGKEPMPLIPEEMSFFQNGQFISVNDCDGDRVMDLPLSLVANVVVDDERHQKLIVAAYNIGHQHGRRSGIEEMQKKLRDMMFGKLKERNDD